jgi:hypothetical protein
LQKEAVGVTVEEEVDHHLLLSLNSEVVELMHD